MNEQLVRIVGLEEPEKSVLRKRRTLFITDDPMDGCTSSEFIKDLLIVVNENTDPVHIIISSEGGSLWSCLAIIRAIRKAQGLGVKIIGHVYGDAFSAAFLVLQACDHRTMGSESILMMHGISHFPGGDSKNIKQDQNMIDQVTSQFCGMLAARNTATDPEYRDPEKLVTQLEDATPNYFTADEAIIAGWVDEIDP